MLNNSGRVTRSVLSKYALLLANESKHHVNDLRVLTSDRKVSKFYSQDAVQAKLKSVADALPINKFVKRSHTCGELGAEHVGTQVQLCGWMEYQRMGKFITLRDSYGSTQLIIPTERNEITDVVANLGYESVLCITGRVVERPRGMQNEKMKTGLIEVSVESLEVLNESSPQLPFNIRHYNVAKEALQMQYRYLALRFPDMQRNLRMRSRVTSKMREYLVDHCGFVDVETPTLFRRTPGGAQEFVVPTQHPGKFYSLVQSPQQFKQLLMIGGIDKYFQIARCYRDEGARNDRQPEFTQLDIEMSFCDREGIMGLVEGLISHFWPSKELGPVKLPIPRLSFEETYEIYGSEQPDLRIPYRIHNITEFFKNDTNDPDHQTYGLVFSSAKSHLTTSARKIFYDIRDKNFPRVNLMDIKNVGDKWKKKLAESLTDEGAAGLEKMLNIKDEDAFIITRGKKHDARTLLGKIRLELANLMESKNVKVRSTEFEFLWVVDFPLFYKDNDGNVASTHHPFTQPHFEDFHLLETDPLKVRGLHYDLVLNGSEIAGGSMRIHNADLQKRMLDMLQIDQSQMKHLTDALASGAPPHGGIAFGLDRLISLMCKTPSIRNVIAFPKTMEGRDLMSGAPTEISEKEKKIIIPVRRVYREVGDLAEVKKKARSDEHQVVLTNVSPDFDGKYRCEVSKEPDFSTMIVAGYMHVAHLPNGGPVLRVEKPRYEVGDIIRGNCTTPPSNPPANVTWIINGNPINASSIKRTNPKGDNRTRTFATLDFEIIPDSFKNGRLQIVCHANVFQLYNERADVVLDEERPKLASVLGTRDSPHTGTASRVVAQWIYVGAAANWLLSGLR